MSAEEIVWLYRSFLEWRATQPEHGALLTVNQEQAFSTALDRFALYGVDPLGMTFKEAWQAANAEEAYLDALSDKVLAEIVRTAKLLGFS